MSNLIQSHEAAILAEVGSKKLEDMQDRLIQFKNNQSKEKSDTGQYYECIRQYRDLEREADIALTGIEANLSRVFKSEKNREITNTIIVAFKKSKSDAVVRMNEALKISKMNMLQFTNKNLPNKHQSRTLSKHALTQNSLKHLLAHEKLKSVFTAEGEEPEYKCLAQLIKHREDLMTQGLILEEEYNKANEDITAANEKIIYHFRLNSLSIYSEDVIPSSIEKKLTDVEDQLAHHFKINFRVIYSAEINLLIRDLKTELSNVRFDYKQKLFHPRHHNDKNKISLINNTNRNTVKAYKQWIKRGDCREKILALHHLKTKTKNSRKVEKQWQYLDKERLKRQKDKAALEDTERTMKKVTQKTEEKIEALRQTIIKQVILDIKDPICDALDREHEIRLELLQKVQTEARRVKSKKESLLMSKTREANRIKTALTEERKCKAKIKIKNHLRLKEKKLNHIKILKKHQQYEDEMKRLERVKTNKLRYVNLCFKFLSI